jgi:hypothetical protein
VGVAYPDKVGNSTVKDKCYIPDHIYATNGEDEEEQAKTESYALMQLPGFKLAAHIKPPYLAQESQDHEQKEREARQYLSLLAASALHDRMLLRSLRNKAQAENMIALDRELCIYGMTCCAGLITIFKMSIRDIWSNPDLSRIKKSVRYDFNKVESLRITSPSIRTLVQTSYIVR